MPLLGKLQVKYCVRTFNFFSKIDMQLARVTLGIDHTSEKNLVGNIHNVLGFLDVKIFHQYELSSLASYCLHDEKRVCFTEACCF